MIPSSSEMSRALSVLASTFGYSSFRPLQADIVAAILRGQDVTVLMPTGGGKSLCYQLPALLMDGTTIVVSPLIALMKDQVDALEALGISATYINSSLDAAEIARRQDMLANGAVKIVYVAPERLLLPAFLRLLENTKIAFLAVDEAHCISEWGHDFRPEYRDLNRLRQLFPDVPLGAFTATATVRVRDDIMSQLGMQETVAFQGSFNRPNLFYEVRPKKGAYANLLSYIRAHPEASGIVYCGSRAGAEDLAARLKADGLRAGAYHAGLSSEERHRRHEAFMRDDIHVMTATVAFGMGIDKPDVRFVVHYDVPKTLENFYQESGRAGRDGDPSDAILYYSPGDIVKLRHFADEKGTPAERRSALRQIQQMADWADTVTCRRRLLLAYFGERFDEQPPPCCDVCRDQATTEDATVAAQMLLSCIKRTGERFGAAYVIDVLRGSRNQRILDFKHDALSTYGIGIGRSVDQWRELTRQLIHGGYIQQNPDHFNALTVTERGRAVLFNNEVVSFVVRQTVERRAAETQPHGDLFDHLRALRKGLANERGIPPYVIFHDRTLREMAALLPGNRQELMQIQGIGERKAADFGEAFLSMITQYARETGVSPTAGSTPPRRSHLREGLSDSAYETARLFQSGREVREIVETRGLARTTIEGHLEDAIHAGEAIDLDRLVATDKRNAIREAFTALGPERLKPVMDRLGAGYTYGDLRLVRAADAVHSS